VSTSLLPLDTLAGTIKAHIAAGDKAQGKAEEHYKAAGIHLMEARDRVKSEGKAFSAFLIGHHIGSSRAYELIAIANGTKTLADIRATVADRAARHADKNRRAREASVSNGQPKGTLEEKQSSPLVESEIERLKGQLATAQAEVARLTEENESLRANRLHLIDDEREIAEKLVEMDGKKLAKLTKILNDYLKHAPQTSEEVSIVLGYSGLEDDNGRRLSTKAALAHRRNPPPPQEYSWRVEAVTADETRWGNGVRLWTEEEAKTYADSYARFDVDGYVTADIIRCVSEPPTNGIFAKRGRPTLTFEHGTCGSLKWRPLPNSECQARHQLDVSLHVVLSPRATPH